jgi:predicted amidohydrolase YtcJ
LLTNGEVGKPADMLLLNADILSVKPEKIISAKRELK